MSEGDASSPPAVSHRSSAFSRSPSSPMLAVFLRTGTPPWRREAEVQGPPPVLTAKTGPAAELSAPRRGLARTLLQIPLPHGFFPSGRAPLNRYPTLPPCAYALLHLQDPYGSVCCSIRDPNLGGSNMPDPRSKASSWLDLLPLVCLEGEEASRRDQGELASWHHGVDFVSIVRGCCGVGSSF